MNHSPASPSPLQEFATCKCETAFAQIIADHGGLVFGSAMRRTGERELAEEVTQNVFAILARKATSVAKHPSLTGWLFTTTKLESAKAMRSRHRHQRKIAALAAEPIESRHELTNTLLSQLDEALDQLPKPDHELLLDRFANEVPFRELARRTGKTEAACKMRIKRTLEKLRHFLTARGTAVSVTTLGTVLGTELSRALPISLAANLPSQALATATTLNSGNLIFDPLIHFMNTAKTSTVAAAVIVIGAIPVAMQHRSTTDLREELEALKQQRPIANLVDNKSNRTISSRASLTPIARYFSETKVPESGEELLATFFELQMNGNMAGIFKIFIPLSRADESKIQSLIEEVEACDKFSQVKGSTMKMLFEFSGARDESPGEAIELMIKRGVPIQSLSQDISDWYDKDSEAALAWFSEKTASGRIGWPRSTKFARSFFRHRISSKNDQDRPQSRAGFSGSSRRE